MKTLQLAALLLAFMALVVLGQDNSLAGTWKISGDVMGYPVNQTCTFSQDGKKLTGTCKSDDGSKPAEATGEVSDKKVSWKYDSEYNGEKLIIVFAGTLEGGNLSGSIDVQPMSASGTFTAKKEEAKK